MNFLLCLLMFAGDDSATRPADTAKQGSLDNAQKQQLLRIQSDLNTLAAQEKLIQMQAKILQAENNELIQQICVGVPKDRLNECSVNTDLLVYSYAPKPSASSPAKPVPAGK